ncbi:MAG: hypothetical protein EP297_02590 [Gammaproteobacteria bacterium]|nr:MAG: hypothetical protein EP297_02590 [Gammaproteobacteria bacterium]
MNEDALNMSVRKFLKKVGVSSQREIEKAINEAVKDGRISDNTVHKVQMTLDLGGLSEPFVIQGDIQIEFSE